jgi:hypothetical protein
MNKLPNHTSLKEWANAIEALGRGDQVILIRKGGIADPAFGVEAERFYLYPTYFHQPEQASHSGVTITNWCEVVRTWRLHDLELLSALGQHVVFPRDVLETRYRFRPDQALHVIGVRTFTLPRPVTIVAKPEYAGCRSWVSVDDEIDVNGSTVVLAEAELQAKLDAISLALGQ